MYNIFKSDLYRIFKGKTIKIILLLSIFIELLILLSVKFYNSTSFSNSLDSELLLELKKMGYLNNDILNVFTNFAFDFLSIIIFILVIISNTFAKDLKNNIVKNYIPYGIKRNHYILAKFFSISLATAIICFTSAIFNIIFYFLLLDFNPFTIMDIIKIIFIFCCVVSIFIAFVSANIFSSLVFKKTPLIILMGLLIYSVISGIYLTFIYGNFKFFDIFYKLSIRYNLKAILSSSVTIPDFLWALFSSTLYSIVFLFFSINLFNKIDLK